MTRARSRSGFTLVEAVVLLVILGVVAASAAPRFLSLEDMDAARAHRQARDDLRFARQLAASSGCAVQVDFTGSGYVLTHRDACRTGTFTRPIVDPTTNSPPFAIAAPRGVVVTSTTDPLIFDERGRATTLAGIVTSVEVRIGARDLDVVGETGLVRVR